MDESSMIHNLEEAINGEYNTIYCYEHLADLAPSDEIKKRIMEIRSDEVRHYEMFWDVYYSLTGKEFQPEITKKCSTSYSAGVLAAFLDEQKTTEFYHRAMREASATEAKKAFDSAAKDEQNHAVWYLYYLTELGN